MSAEKIREELAESIKQLAGDVRFKAFVRELENMRDDALNNAIIDASLQSPGTAYAALGEVRTYLAILNLVKEYTEKGVDS